MDFYLECNRPKTFNSWAQVTILHMWAIMVRIRAFPDETVVKIWQQHFIDHFFFDAEEKMQFQYGVQFPSLPQKENPNLTPYLTITHKNRSNLTPNAPNTLRTSLSNTAA